MNYVMASDGYYFECETRKWYENGEVEETIDMDIFLEFLEQYHAEKWKANNWQQVQLKKWKGTDVIWGEPTRIRKYKRYVENAYDMLCGKKELYRAYHFYLDAYYNN